MRKIYRVGFTIRIDEFDVERETEHNVWLRSQSGATFRQRKKSHSGAFYNTRAEALKHIHDRLKKRVEHNRDGLDRALKDLATFEADPIKATS